MSEFAEQIKYLGVLLHASLKDDNGIQRQVTTLDSAANKLKRIFARCSTAVKNIPFRAYCAPRCTCQLWCNSGI